MKLGMVGLGKMGGAMAERLLRGEHQVVGFDPNVDALAELSAQGGETATTLADLVGALDAPRVVWVMVPAGKITAATIDELAERLEPGDIVVDGGNSNFNETLARAAMLREKGIEMIDAGTSGGVWGLAEGYSLMVGGSDEAVATLRPALECLAPAPDKGWGHVGPSGSGHYVKMVHNGIEYGMMQAYAEGFGLMASREDFNLDMHQISGIWRHGSVVRSWLLDLAENALAEEPDLASLEPFVSDSGEGRWTVQEAIDQAIPVPVITAALMARFSSRGQSDFANKMLSALRNQFGGHAMKKRDS